MSLYQTAGDTGGGSALARRNDDSHPVVPASPHGAASCIHHKANQKPAGGKIRGQIKERQKPFSQQVWKPNVKVTDKVAIIPPL